MNAAEHLELHLGPIERGWSSPSRPGVQVCLFRDQPDPGQITLATLGLSNTVLAMSGGRQVRQELLLVFHDDLPPDDPSRLLIHVADLLITSEHAILRGELVPFEDELVPGCRANALYAAIPVVFPDEFATLRDSSPPTVFVWMIPVHPPEAELVRSLGWSDLEDLFESDGTDLSDLHRRSVVPREVGR